ncbi:hypothetical protein JYU12_02165 [bacterium AH-315-K03]|nr:hypothetical protein [bacterium AH-315-K03]
MRVAFFVLILSYVLAPSAFAQSTKNADAWLTHPMATEDKNPLVLYFRRSLELNEKPKSFPITLTADNRFILYVNGQRVLSGPSTGDVQHWRESRLDIAQYLTEKHNVIAAVVWNGVKPLNIPDNASEKRKRALQGAALFTQTAPSFQKSLATGFRLIGEAQASVVSTDKPGWRVKIDEGRSFTNGWRQLKRWYYVAGHPETIDATRSDFDWNAKEESKDGWHDAVPAPLAANRTLVVDKLPQQLYRKAAAGKVVRSELQQAKNFPAKSVLVPANSKISILLQRDAMISAYPQLDVSGGEGAVIRVTYSEALYDEKMKKADRNLIEERKPFGPYDTFTSDGGERTFAPLWWRTWRYVEIHVETKKFPLTLNNWRVFETGYPFEQVGKFESNDKDHKRIFDIGWRTARVDAHETYMDTAFWEQLQYAGDTRLQMLISYAVSGDARLAEQAIDAFAASYTDEGLMLGAYPSRTDNSIATFSLVWVGMLSDWLLHQSDPAPVIRHLDRMREVLNWFEQWQRPSGLLGKNPQWNFIDWVGQLATDRDRFPSWGELGESCLMSVIWFGALQQGVTIDTALGHQHYAQHNSARADKLAKAINQHCWSSEKGLFADNPDLTIFSQHMNAMAVLYGLVDQEKAQNILKRIVAPGKGIDAPEGITTTSYYFAWYLIQAHVHAGLGDRYLELLNTWRDLMALNYTTWPEERGDTRSDSHAWSAHPTADLLGIVAGIGPGALGYSRLRIEPNLGALKKLRATAATPKGPVRVEYRVRGKYLKVKIRRPPELPGEFIWQGRAYPLTKPVTKLMLRRR